MTLEETLKYMEEKAHLQETSVNGLNQIINSQNLSNEIKIQQGQGNDIIINGIKYPGDIGKSALNTIAMQIHPDKTQGLSKDQILKNVITATAGINKGSIGKSIQQNMSLPQPANQGQNQLVIKKNGQELSPESQEYKELQTVAQKVGIEKAQQMYQQQGYNVEFTPPTQITDGTNGQTPLSITDGTNQNNLPATQQQRTPQQQQAAEIQPIDTNQLQQIQNITDDGSFQKSVEGFDNLINKTQSDFENAINQIKSFINDPEVQQALNQAEQETKKAKGKWEKAKGILGTVAKTLGGALNTVAGMAGNFIGGIASGMGAAK